MSAETTPNSCICGSCSCSDKDARIAELEAIVALLGVALEPFASAAERETWSSIPAPTIANAQTMAGYYLSWADFHRARSALLKATT